MFRSVWEAKDLYRRAKDQFTDLTQLEELNYEFDRPEFEQFAEAGGFWFWLFLWAPKSCPLRQDILDAFLVIFFRGFHVA